MKNDSALPQAIFLLIGLILFSAFESQQVGRERVYEESQIDAFY